jgi:hypothetical protein
MTTQQRAWLCETYQVRLSAELGVVCSSGFIESRQRRKYEVKFVTDPVTKIQEPQLVLGEVEGREEQDAVFLLPLVRYDYKSGSGLKHVRMSLDQLNFLNKMSVADMDKHFKGETLEACGIKVKKEPKAKVEKESSKLSFDLNAMLDAL